MQGREWEISLSVGAGNVSKGDGFRCRGGDLSKHYENLREEPETKGRGRGDLFKALAIRHYCHGVMSLFPRKKCLEVNVRRDKCWRGRINTTRLAPHEFDLEARWRNSHQEHQGSHAALLERAGRCRARGSKAVPSQRECHPRSDSVDGGSP